MVNNSNRMVNIIVAINPDGIIGINGSIPWHCPEDLRYFKFATRNHGLIMGRKTWESLPKKPLPGRPNIVVSSTMESGTNFNVVRSLEEAIDLVNVFGIPAFVIGGENLYREAIIKDMVDHLIITIFDHEIKYGPEDEIANFPAELICMGNYQIISIAIIDNNGDSYNRFLFKRRSDNVDVT